MIRTGVISPLDAELLIQLIACSGREARTCSPSTASSLASDGLGEAVTRGYDMIDSHRHEQPQ